MRALWRQMVVGVRVLLMMTLVLGLLYPAAVWLVGSTALTRQADGSLLSVDGRIVGSSLIGQRFSGPMWFHSRPSASGYDAMASGASNLAPTSPQLLRQVERRKASIARLDAVAAGGIAPDGVTASGSGLDPDISPAFAQQQAGRVAKARSVPVSDILALVDANTRGRTLGILGEPVVNVLELNIALQQLLS